MQKCRLTSMGVIFGPTKITVLHFLRNETLPFVPFVGLEFELPTDTFYVEKVIWNQDKNFTLKSPDFWTEDSDDAQWLIDDMKNDGFQVLHHNVMERTEENEKDIKLVLGISNK